MRGQVRSLRRLRRCTYTMRGSGEIFAGSRRLNVMPQPGVMVLNGRVIHLCSILTCQSFFLICVVEMINFAYFCSLPVQSLRIDNLFSLIWNNALIN